jgi:hypothetical protein
MTSNFNLNLLAETQPSICIPRVFNNISELKIRQVFDELSLGKISRIDIKERKNEKGEVFNRVYIHFEKWFWNEDAQTARRKLTLGKEIKIIYDKPWFWKVSASKWEEPSKQKLLLQDKLSQKRSSSVYINFDDEDNTDEFGRDLRLSDLNADDDYERGLSLSLSDLNTTSDKFGRDLHLSDLNTTSDKFGRDLHLSDLNTTSDKFGRDLHLSDLNTTNKYGSSNLRLSDLNATTKFGSDLRLSDLNSTDVFGRDLSFKRDLNSTDEFGRDLSLKRDYDEQRINNLINNFKPINRRLSNDRRSNDRRSNDRRSNDRRSNDRRSNDRRSNDRRSKPRPEPEPVKEEEEEERPILPFRSIISEDVDNLNIPKFEIDYGTPLPVPKIKRTTIKKSNVSTPIPIPIIKKPINWYDNDTDDDETTNDTDVFLTQIFNKISINDNDNKFRPRSPDYPPPDYLRPKNQEEEEFDIYADLNLDL